MADSSTSAAGRTRRWAKKPVPAAGMNASETNQGDVAALPPPPAAAAPLKHDAPERQRAVERKGKGKGGRGYGKSEISKGSSKGASLMAGPYNAGVQSAFSAKYQADLDRLYARSDLPEDARWIDSHCHLESILARTWRGGGKPQVLDNEPMVDLLQLAELWPRGLEACVSNFAFRRPSKPGFPPEWRWLETNLHHFEDGLVADKLWFTIGIHPHDAGNWDGAAEAMVRKLASHPKCVGVGECGLDFFKHDQGETDLQLRAFRAQAAIAVELGKALVVHGRLVTAQNEELCMKVLRDIVPPEHPVHIHCYGDSLDHAKQLCDRWPNLRLGFTGSITFRDKPKGKGKGGLIEKKGEAHSRELISGLPVDRLLLETDGPYMCPDPFRGQTAHPGHVHRVAEKIAEWKGLSLGDVMKATRHSTKIVYGI